MKNKMLKCNALIGLTISEIFYFSDDEDVLLPPPLKIFKMSEFEEYENCDDNQSCTSFSNKSNEPSLNASTSFASSKPDNFCLPSTSTSK